MHQIGHIQINNPGFKIIHFSYYLYTKIYITLSNVLLIANYITLYNEITLCAGNIGNCIFWNKEFLMKFIFVNT